ncbi:MAG TPA: protein kinase [Thermoanaerobaculia bacterium]|nr:protein kinase [Thermoanaerobaculia bacterium]
MSLAPGSRLGPYEVVASIGAGGMGEVYKAKDTRLDRTVAVKVLPAHLSSSPESRQRFEREAKTISQLSHPHICALYDVGSEGETEYLVMEHLEGETLLQRLANGALPLEQTLRYGQEIADALDKAHRQGIVHRDLKPANVMITKSGVKLLDFGLAKAIQPPAPKGSLTSLPTQQGLTQEGTILGTFQYMAPEQLEGKESDARTDIFGFGAVLYEMATGRKAFSGSSQASLISSIMKEDPPPVSTIQAMSPPALDRVVKTCLAKDPEDRWQSAHDVANELKWIAEGSAAALPAPAAARRGNRERVAWAFAAAAAALAALLVAAYLRLAPNPERLVRASIVLPEKMYAGEFAVSPDGRRVVVSLQKDVGPTSLWVRDLDAESAVEIPGTEGASFPFWSPDGRSIGFFDDGKLKKLELSGGAALVICDAAQGVGGTWNRDGVIVFAPDATSPLFRVPASGGQPVAVTKLDPSRKESAHRYPSFLPDGRHFLYTATNLGAPGGDPGNAIHVASLDGKDDRILVSAFSNAQFSSGRLFYARDGALLAQTLDLERLATSGDPVVVIPRAENVTRWAAFFAYSVSGSTLVAVPPFYPPSRLVWFDRSGRQVGSIGVANQYGAVRLSPDDRKVAFAVVQPLKQTSEIWIYDVASGSSSKLVFGPSYNVFPVFSPDGSRIVFASDRRARTQRPDLWIKALDGSKEELFLDAIDSILPSDWSRDGRFLLVSKVPFRGRRNTEVWLLDGADPKQQRAVAVGDANETGGAFSPDGKWIAYISDESGTLEVYVRASSGEGGKWKVSSSGGSSPRWRGDGKELFYADLSGKILAVSVNLDAGFHASEPTTLFEAHASFGPDPFGLSGAFDVAADGQKFLVNVEPESSGSPPLSLILNWPALLKEPSR